jgi:hypothetical protein
LNKFESLLLVDSPFEAFSNIFDLRLPIPNYESHRARIRFELDTLHEIPESVPGPKIVYTHLLTTHPPFVLDQDGELVQRHQPYSLWDGSEFKEEQHVYWNGYREQVIFSNKEIIWDFNDPGCLWERTSNLYALLLPGHQNDGTLYSSISPVNSFRVIFNTYFGTDLPLLEDKTYLTSWQQPSLMVDVSSKTDSTESYTMPDL